MLHGRVLWKSYFIVFVASACGLIIELVAGRILAPFIGVSLYTWTSIIGVVLAGISLGNYLGGRIADRAPRPQTLGVLFFLSGLSSLLILALIQGVGQPCDGSASPPDGQDSDSHRHRLFPAESSSRDHIPGGSQAQPEGPEGDGLHRWEDLRLVDLRKHRRHLRHRLRAHILVWHPRDRGRRCRDLHGHGAHFRRATTTPSGTSIRGATSRATRCECWCWTTWFTALWP